MKGAKSFSSQEPLLKLRNLNKVHCPTVKLNVSPSGNYGNIVGISKYCNELMQPGGINFPKRIACIGTDGEKYLQLLKGMVDQQSIFYFNYNEPIQIYLLCLKVRTIPDRMQLCNKFFAS